jgi:hypothetical protein
MAYYAETGRSCPPNRLTFKDNSIVRLYFPMCKDTPFYFPLYFQVAPQPESYIFHFS